MRRSCTSRWNILTAACLALATFTGSAPTTAATVTVSYRVVISYQWTTVYETRTEAYTRVVTLYDHCGKAYTATKTCYRIVEVPVKKLVAVKKLVPCY